MNKIGAFVREKCYEASRQARVHTLRKYMVQEAGAASTFLKFLVTRFFRVGREATARPKVFK